MATQMLLRAINMSGKLHMVPAVINDDYVIRFAVCSVNASDDDILYAWNIIKDMTSKLSNQSASFDVYRSDQHVCCLHCSQCWNYTVSQKMATTSLLNFTVVHQPILIISDTQNPE